MKSSADTPGPASPAPPVIPQKDQAANDLTHGLPLSPTPVEHAEDAAPVQRSLSLLAAIVASAQDAIVSSDLHERIETWNPAAERLFGYTAAEAIGQPFSLILPANGDDERHAFLTQVVTEGGALCRETQRRHRDGSLIEVETTVTTIRDASGAVQGYASITRDISDRKAQERQLRELESRYHVFFEQMPGLSYIYTPGTEGQNRGSLHLSEHFAELTGYHADSDFGEADFVDAVVHPLDRDRIRALNQTIERSGEPLCAEYRIVTRDGRVLWVRDQASLITDNAGARKYWLGFMVDITTQKQVEAEREATHHDLREVLERITDGFFALDGDGRMTYINEAASRLLPRNRDEYIGANFWDEFPVVHGTTVSASVQQAISEGTTTSFDYYYPKFDTWYESRVYPSPNGVSIFFRDVTEQKRSAEAAAAALNQLQRANEELERLNTAKSEFVSTISHEFRTPLTSIQGFSELLETEDLSLDEVRAFAHTVNQNAVRLARMIGDVLDLDALEAGHREIRREPLSLNHLVDGVLTAMRPMARGHRIVARFDSALPAIFGDSDLLERVITNLVANAIKYSPAGSEITLSTALRQDGVQLTVADHGIGVPAEHRETIFARYGRITRPEQIGIEGTGLGLPIARHILEVHNGRIWVEENTPTGSIFHVVLPAGEQR